LKAFLWGVVAIFVATLAGEVVSFLFSSGQNWSDLKNYITNEYYSVSSLNILAILGLLFLRGPIEEGVIFIIFMLFIYREKAFTQTIDGIVYGVALALGFSFVENTIYFTELFSTLYIGQARFLNKKKWRTIIKGVLIAMVLHGTFNVFLQASYPLNVSLAFILILGLYFNLVSFTLLGTQHKESQVQNNLETN